MTTKQGIQVTTTNTGLNEFHIVEYTDGSAELFNTWDEAITAGKFEADDVAA